MDKSDKDTGKIQEWIQCVSKSRPGIKYMFNTATGESKWLAKDGVIKEIAATSKKEGLAKKLKTPAQDRLKRLQKDNVKDLKNHEKSSKPLKRFHNVVVSNPEISKKSEKKDTKVRKVENTPCKDNKVQMAKTRKRVNSSPERPNKISKKLEDMPVKVLQQSTHFKIPKKKTVSSSQEQDIINGKPQGKLLTHLPNKTINKFDNRKADELVKESLTYNVNKKPVQSNPTSGINFKEETGLANKRLEELRKSLQKALDSKIGDTSEKLERQNYIYNLKSPEKSPNDFQKVEPMDWESDVVNFTAQSTSGYNKNAINDNLKHYATGQRSPKEKNEKWKKDFYYFIPDTNVFLDHITFLDELSTMKLHDTQGTMLYIPYVVIKELDGLKMREKVALRARRAINYIHDKLKNKCPHVQTQSAIDERDCIIEVDGPDDAIINCCLQVQRYVEKVLLLSEDTNLRNKAQFNDLLVSTKSDLISIHAHTKSTS